MKQKIDTLYVFIEFITRCCGLQIAVFSVNIMFHNTYA